MVGVKLINGRETNENAMNITFAGGNCCTR